MVNVTICPCCGNKNFSSFLTCMDHSVSHEPFALSKCANCNLAATTPRPENTTIGKYYKSENYISHTGQAQSFIDKVYLFVRNYSLKWKLRLIQKDTLPSKVLDYGCGTGEFLKVCKDFKWTAFGMEPSETARSKAIHLTKEKIASSLEEITAKDFNIITLWHVLEHVEDPSKTLRDLISKLKPGGKVFVAVPNYTSYDATVYKQFWAGYDVPRHLWHFSPQSMKILLDNNSMKLDRIIPMKLDSFYVSLLSEKYMGTSSLLGFIKAFTIGLVSNLHARRSGNYSSLIYIASK